MRKFKKGDKVRFVGINNDPFNDMSRVMKKAGITENSILTVDEYFEDSYLYNQIYNHESHPYYFKVITNGGAVWLVEQNFERVGVIIVLRRQSDRKSIEKFLISKGYRWDLDSSTEKEKDQSRIIIVHPGGFGKGNLNFNGQVGFQLSTKNSIASTQQHMSSIWNYTESPIVKTKPSVNKAIGELENLI